MPRTPCTRWARRSSPVVAVPSRRPHNFCSVRGSAVRVEMPCQLRIAALLKSLLPPFHLLGDAVRTPFVPGSRRTSLGVPSPIVASAGRVGFGLQPRDRSLVVFGLFASRTILIVDDDPTAGTPVSLGLEQRTESSCICGVTDGCKGFRRLPREQSCTNSTS